MRAIGGLFVVSLTVLAGCAADGPNVVKDVSGRVIGFADLRDISPGESTISFDNPPKTITRYQKRTLPDSVQEIYSFSQGYINLFRHLGGLSYFMETTDTSLKFIATIAEGNGKQYGIEAKARDAVRGQVPAGPYAYVRGTRSGAQCTIYQLPLTRTISSLAGGYMGYMSGFMCGSPGETREKVDADTVRFLGSIVFDAGELNRARGVSIPAAAPAPAPTATRTPTPSPGHEQRLAALPDTSICLLALDSPKQNWDARAGFQAEVREAQRRQFTVEYCRSLAGPVSATIPTPQPAPKTSP